MDKYAGVTIDYYDDGGQTIKSMFPTQESLPGAIKEAQVMPKDKVPQGSFALTALNGGEVMQKFACVDAGTTAMSTIYFMEHGDKLPLEAQKTAAANLVRACTNYGMLPPEPLTKVASLELGDVVDITGKSPEPVTKVASPDADSDYAVVLPDGQRMFPINSWDLIKQASVYYEENCKRMEPQVRRQFAVKLASKATAVGYPLDDYIRDDGALSLADSGHRRTAIEMRKVAFAPTAEDREELDELFEKSASVDPENYAVALHMFDARNGLDTLWGSAIPDPWQSTYGLTKEAEVIWEAEGERLLKGDLVNLAANHSSGIGRLFGSDALKEFMEDPVGVFESMPLPQKKIIARLATDTSSDGGTELSTKDSAWQK